MSISLLRNCYAIAKGKTFVRILEFNELLLLNYLGGKLGRNSGSTDFSNIASSYNEW